MTIQPETIRLEELKPAPYNPRIMTTSQTQKLQKNLETFGLVDPIIINTKNKHIIGGHQRYHILQEKYTDKELHLIRLGDIGWVFTEDTLTVEDENHEKALNLALNRLNGEFDDGKVQEMLEDLTESHLDMDLTGFEDYEITEYLMDDLDNLNDLLPDGNEFSSDEEVINEQEDNTAPSETPYTPLREVEVIVKEGDKYQLGNHVLLCADSSERRNIEKLLSGERVDLLLTDPPYGIDVVSTGSTERERERESI